MHKTGKGNQTFCLLKNKQLLLLSIARQYILPNVRYFFAIFWLYIFIPPTI